MIGHMQEIDYKTAVNFILPRHYSGRVPTISKAFGWYKALPNTTSNLVAVCTFGKPASPSLCKGVCGPEFSSCVYELNRLCRLDDWQEPLSMFIAFCLKELKKENWVVVSYADTGMGHNGYVYQACNFIYTGATKERTDKWTPGNKHPRHYDNNKQGQYRKLRTAKHRYIYFCTNNKRLKKKWQKHLRYPVQSYPKGPNRYYTLGEYMQPILVKTK